MVEAGDTLVGAGSGPLAHYLRTCSRLASGAGGLVALGAVRAPVVVTLVALLILLLTGRSDTRPMCDDHANAPREGCLSDLRPIPRPAPRPVEFA